MGAITNIVKRYVPASYRAMVGASGVTDYYSVTELQALAEFVQWRIYSTIAVEASEAGVYNTGQRELLGMLTTLQFIPVAVEYWGDQLASETTTGTHETISYFDRRADLWKIFDRLSKEAAELAVDVGVVVNKARAITPKVSYGDNGRGILLTPDPHDFPASYDVKRTSDLIPWGT